MTDQEKVRFLEEQLNNLYPTKDKIFELAVKNLESTKADEFQNVEKKLILGDYKVVGRLGHGQFGQVYLVTPKDESDYLAIKVNMIRRDVDIKAATAELTMNELRKAQNIPCMLPYLDGTSDLDSAKNAHISDNIQFVMPVGLSYSHYMTYILEKRNNTFQRTEILALMYHLFSNLTILHQHQIIHRDIKPDNIMLIPSEQGGIRLVFADFGTSRVVDSATCLTNCGTPIFIPQALRNYTYDRLSPEDAMKFDVYSVAVTCYTIFDAFKPLEPSSREQHLIVGKPHKVPRPCLCPYDDIWNILKNIISNSNRLSAIPSAEEVCSSLDQLLFS